MGSFDFRGFNLQGPYSTPAVSIPEEKPSKIPAPESKPVVPPPIPEVTAEPAKPEPDLVKAEPKDLSLHLLGSIAEPVKETLDVRANVPESAPFNPPNALPVEEAKKAQMEPSYVPNPAAATATPNLQIKQQEAVPLASRRTVRGSIIRATSMNKPKTLLGA